jgi:hypothetical protein
MKRINASLDRRDFLGVVGMAAGAAALTNSVPADLAAAPTGSELAQVEKPSLDVGKEPKLTVVTVTSHCDWTWRCSRAWHEYLSANLTHQYLMIMRDYPAYVWQAESPPNQLSPFFRMASDQWPGLIDEFWRRVREGRIELGQAYNNPRLSEVYPEIFVRNLVLGKEYFRRHAPGVQQKVYNAADVMCGHSQMPQLLSQADYRYFMFSRPDNHLQITFWRQGLDGTRMLSSKSLYGTDNPSKPPANYGKVFHGIQPLPIWRMAVGGDWALPSPEVARVAKAWDPQKMVLSTLTRFFEECEKYSKHISELEGPLDSLSYFNGAGLYGNYNIYTQNNQNEDLLLSVEKAQVMATMLGRTFFVDESVDQLWREVLSCIAHGIEWSFRDDYEERMTNVHNTRGRARRVLEEVVNDIGIGVPHAWKEHSPLMVFNFHGWPMTGPVEFKVDGDKNGTQGIVLRDSQGNGTPLQFASYDPNEGTRLAFIAQDIPACGYKTFYLSRLPQGSGPVIPSVDPGLRPIENAHYRIEMSADGKLTIFDKVRRKVLGSPEVGGLGDLAMYDMPSRGGWDATGPAGKRRDWQLERGQCQSVQGPVFSTLRACGRIEGPDGAHRVTREVRLWGDSQRIEYNVEIDAKHDNGIFCICFAVGIAGDVSAGIPFGVESRDNLKNELFRPDIGSWELWAGGGFPEGYDATRWTDVSDSEYGYTFICPQGMHTGYTFKKNDKSLEFILLRTRSMPEDEFRQCPSLLQGVGRHTWRCALVPHENTWREALSYRQALEQHNPLLAHSPLFGLDCGGVTSRRPFRFNPKTGGSFGVAVPEWYLNPPPPLPAQFSLVEVAPPNVVLSSMRLIKSGSGKEKPEYELRLYETAGQATDVVVKLGCAVGSVRRTNFLGEPLDAADKIKANGQEILFHIQPWKIVTLRIGGTR